MFTKWFKLAMRCFIPFQFNNGGSAKCINEPIKNVLNATYYPSGQMQSVNTTSLVTTPGNNGVSVGTGNRAATDEDYQLESTITSGLSGVITKTFGEDGTKTYVNLNVVLSNTTKSDIVVKEIGIKANIPCGSSAGAVSGFSNRTVLIDRTVLPEPVTVPAQGNAAILYTLKTDYNFT